jgi:hypothetical protein
MKIRALFAKDIRVFSMLKKQAEWLLAPNTCLSIDKVFTSHDLADMKGLGVPENVDLILASQQQVSAEDILAAQENDKSDLAVFKTQQFLIRPSPAPAVASAAPAALQGEDPDIVALSQSLKALGIGTASVCLNFAKSLADQGVLSLERLKKLPEADAREILEGCGLKKLQVGAVMEAIAPPPAAAAVSPAPSPAPAPAPAALLPPEFAPAAPAQVLLSALSHRFPTHARHRSPRACSSRCPRAGLRTSTPLPAKRTTPIQQRA